MDSSHVKKHRKVASDRVRWIIQSSVPESDVDDLVQKVNEALQRREVDPALGTQDKLEGGILRNVLREYYRKSAMQQERERPIEEDVPGLSQTGVEGINDEVLSVLGIALDRAYFKSGVNARAVIRLTVAGERQEYIGCRVGIDATAVSQAVFKFRQRYSDCVKAIDPGVFKTLDDSSGTDIDKVIVDIGEAYAARVALMELDGKVGPGYFPSNHVEDWDAIRAAWEAARAVNHGRGSPPPRFPSVSAIDGERIIKCLIEAAAVVQNDTGVPPIVCDVFLDRLAVVKEIIAASIKQGDGHQLERSDYLSTSLLLVRRPFPLYPSYYPLAVLAAFAGVDWVDD